MKLLPPCCVLVCAGLLLGGCASSLASRIREQPAVFQSLTPRQQKQIKDGRIKVGDTAAMVYLALGRPSRVSTPTEAEIRLSLSGTATASKVPGEVWIYARYMPRPGELRSPPPEVRAPNRDLENIVVDGPAKGYSLPSRETPMGLAGGSVDIHTLRVFFCTGTVAAIELVD